MTAAELRLSLTRLNLTQAEAAQLLGVASRTVRRWLDDEEIPGPTEQALRAWIRLHERNLPWRPDAESVVRDDQDEIARHRALAIGLDELLARVEARGGPRVPWSVDRGRQIATLGPLEVSYYKLTNGGFSLANYRRKDGDPNVQRDWEAIEDAAACIARALKKDPEFGPVILVVRDDTTFGRIGHVQQIPFESNREALRHVCASLKEPGFRSPNIIGKNGFDPIWNSQELQRECERRRTGPRALAAIAEYTREHSEKFVRNGPRMLTSAEAAKRRQRIEALADQLAALGEGARDGLVEYHQFESVLGRLHAEGFFPDNELLGDVAKSLLTD